MTPAPPPTRLRAPLLCGAAVWLVAAAWYARTNPTMAATAAGGAAYAAVLVGLVVRLARRPAGGDRLRAATRLPAWYAVAGLTLGWALLYGLAFGGVYGGVRVPGLTPLVADLTAWRLAPGIDGTTLLNFATLGALPAAALLAAGAGRRELGLCAPVPGTGAASAACLLLPAALVGWGLASGRVTAAGVLVAAVHSLLSNGLAEELMCRGVLLPPLRAALGAGWEVVVQGLLFGLAHVGGAVPEEGGDWGAAAAAAVALNAPTGMALGVLAVRTGSLALPTAVHVAGHLMIAVLR